MEQVNFISSGTELDDIINSDEPQIVLYVIDNCPICKRHISDMMHRYNFKFHIFDTNLHKESYKKHKMSMLFPETRVYKSGELKYLRGGQLYESQIEELRNILNTFNGTNN